MASESITAVMAGGPLDGELYVLSDADSTLSFSIPAGEPMADGTPRLEGVTFELKPIDTPNGWRLRWPHEDDL